MDAIDLIVNKNIAKYAGDITIEAFKMYEKCFRRKESPSLSQMYLLLDTINEAVENQSSTRNYQALTERIRKTLKYKEEKDAHKKTGWATLIDGTSLADHVIVMIEKVQDIRCFKMFFEDVQAETSYLNEKDRVEYMAKVQLLKAFFPAVLAMYRLEEGKSELEIYKVKYSLTLNGGILQCLKQNVQ